MALQPRDEVSDKAIREFVNGFLDGVVLTESSGRILEANGAAAHLLGMPRESLVGRDFNDVMHLRRRSTHRGKYQELERPDRSRSVVIVRKAPGLRRGTRLQLLHDVSVERALNETLERKGRMLIDAQREARIGSWELDLERSLIFWTPEMRELMEVPESVEYMTIEESYRYYTLPSREVVREAFDVTLARGTPYDLEVELITGKGNRIWVREVCRATFQRGRLKSLTGFHQDVTEQRRLAELVANVSDRERARIGADLHDGIGQELAGFSLMLKSLAGRAAKQSPAISEELEALSRMAGRSVQAVRDLSHGLIPLEIRELGLKRVLEKLAHSTQDMFAVAVSTSVRGGARWAPGARAAECLYRVAQEAMANAVRHGRARQISLRLQASPTKTVLIVSDDGVGIHPHYCESTGMGLRIMRYRARLLGGFIDVHALPDGGTRVRCILPR